MAILSKFGTHTLKINIADNIQSGVAGVMGDFNSRALNVSVMAENGEVLQDPSIKTKLLCKTEKDQLIFTEGEYAGDGVYTVNFPNEVFEQEQELECIIQLSKDNEILYSKIFYRKVEKGLLGTEREGTSTIIDLLKIMDFADNYEEKLKEMEALGNKEEADIIRKAKAETDKFNSNAKAKTDVVNKIKDEVEGYKNTTVKAKDITLANKADFDKNYNRVTGILDAETDRERAEEERRKHDKEIQDLIDGGLDSAGFVKLEDLTESERRIKSITQPNLIQNTITTKEWSGKWVVGPSDNDIYFDGRGEMRCNFKNFKVGDKFVFSCENFTSDWGARNGEIGYLNFVAWSSRGKQLLIKKVQSGMDSNGKLEWIGTVTEEMIKQPYYYDFNLFYQNIREGSNLKIKRLKLEVGEKATDWVPHKNDFLEKFIKLENDLIEQTEENTARFDAIDKALENANKINDNLILGTNREWNEGRQITKLTDFSFISPFLNGFNRFTETGELTPVTVSYKVKFTDITVVNPVSLYFRLREVTGDTYGGWKEAKDTFTPSISKEFYFKHTFELPQSYFEARNNFKFDFRLDGIPSGYIYIKELKLEYGYKATTWVPAKADIEESNRKSLEVNKRLETKIDKVIKLLGEGNKNYTELLKRDKELIGG